VLNFFRHEFRMIWREPRFWIPFLVPPLFIMISQIYAQMSGSGDEMGSSLLILIGVLLSTMCVNLMADSFAGERERNTLELLLALPISLEKIFFGKMLAVFPVPLGISVVFQVLFWFATNLNVTDLMIAIVTNVSSCIFVGCMALSVSMFSKTVRTAAQISVVFVLMILIVTPIVSIYIFTVPELFLAVNIGYLILSVSLTYLSFVLFKRRGWVK
jgi:ABC-type transport system involved in multi-copper enzyme maturation permease subunit